jgi:hypothetical protein
MDVLGLSFILLAGLGILAYMVACQVNYDRRKDKIEKSIQNLQTFTASQGMIAADSHTGLAIDEKAAQIALSEYDDDIQASPTTTICSYKDIISSEIYEDGTTLTKTSRMSQVKGALLGDLLGGSAGMVIGGLSGKKRSYHEIAQIVLRIIVNNTEKPVYDIVFLDHTVMKTSSEYKMTIAKARHWHALITVLIKRADDNDTNKVNNAALNPPQSQPHSVDKEIVKLALLVKKGLLTEEEFRIQKKKLLARD